MKNALALVVCLGLSVCSAAKGSVLATENFNSDPGWLYLPATGGSVASFGFSSTSYAGGTAGEAGGLFARTPAAQPSAYYGVDLGTPFTLDDYFEMSWSTANPALFGLDRLTFSVDDGNSGTEAGVGFFDRFGPNTSVGTDSSFLGAQTSSDNLYLVIEAGGESDLNLGVHPGLNTLRILYDPALGANGSLRVDLNGAVSTVGLTAAQRASGAVFNTFGMRTLTDNGGWSITRQDDFWLDQVAFSTNVMPEPGTIALLALGGLLIASKRRR